MIRVWCNKGNLVRKVYCKLTQFKWVTIMCTCSHINKGGRHASHILATSFRMCLIYLLESVYGPCFNFGFLFFQIGETYFTVVSREIERCDRFYSCFKRIIYSFFTTHTSKDLFNSSYSFFHGSRLNQTYT